MQDVSSVPAGVPAYPRNAADAGAVKGQLPEPEGREAGRIAGFEVHPLAELFPLMEGEDFAALVADIGTHGLREPVQVDEHGRIVDGRNRALACVEAGVDLRTTSEGVPEGSELLDWIISRNLHRRHLTTGQRAAVAADMATMKEGRPGNSANLLSLSQAEAAALMKVSPRTVTAATAVKKASPEQHAKVKAGEISVNAARKQTRKPEAAANEAEADRGPKADAPPTGAAEALADFDAYLGKHGLFYKRHMSKLYPPMTALRKALDALRAGQAPT
jgi:hypothetical protein